MTLINKRVIYLALAKDALASQWMDNIGDTEPRASRFGQSSPCPSTLMQYLNSLFEISHRVTLINLIWHLFVLMIHYITLIDKTYLFSFYQLLLFYNLFGNFLEGKFWCTYGLAARAF